MRLSSLSVLLVLVSLPLSGCLSGNSYPDRYGQSYCSTLFLCFDQDDIEDMEGWNDVGECRDDVADSIRDSADYDRWEEGDASFDSDAAGACIDEVLEFQGDSSCDGGSLDLFSYAEFLLDVSAEECGEVYD
ncbi:MAG: hypothetical protein VX498_11560 [Myxococcota bacterium]|nr:hypothetical protein [Myxococcota bacterium]